MQVQLLISAQDVENYKVIKSELDKLRMMVEKSELWVEKKGSSKGEDGQEGEKKEKKEVELEQLWGRQADLCIAVQSLGVLWTMNEWESKAWVENTPHYFSSKVCFATWQGAFANPGSLVSIYDKKWMGKGEHSIRNG